MTFTNNHMYTCRDVWLVCFLLPSALISRRSAFSFSMVQGMTSRHGLHQAPAGSMESRQGRFSVDFSFIFSWFKEHFRQAIIVFHKPQFHVR